MEITNPMQRDRITIAILALGGEGGGVLAEWIREVARANGYVAQGTSIAGVAQRTGSTVYYIELFREGAGGGNRPDPVLATMPVPGDVDIVIASELMETGRAILRGFVTEDRTTLIGSTHRVYAISEKSAMGDGTGAAQRILDAAQRRAARFIGFDMAAAATGAGSVISSVMFGALAGSDALPFPRDTFEGAIRHGGKAIEANLKGFDLGFTRAGEGDPVAVETALATEPTTAAGRAFKARIEREMPKPAWTFAIEGVRRLMDYQAANYAGLYLDRLAPLVALDGGQDDFALSREAARYLALWMAYEDTIRVAELKTRGTRSERVENEVRLGAGQVMNVTEYMHPRLREVCDVMPAGLGRFVMNSPAMRRMLEPFFTKGRHVATTSLRWHLALRMVAALRAIRPSTLRYREEQERIEEWLGLATQFAATDRLAAVELLSCQQLLKGYSDTFDRGLASFTAIMGEAHRLVGQADAAATLRTLREAALADENGYALSCVLSQDKAA